MTIWLVAAAVLLLGLIPCLFLAARGDSPVDGVIGLVAAGVVIALVLLLLAVGYERPIYGDVAVVVAVLSFAGGLVFVQYLERWG